MPSAFKFIGGGLLTGIGQGLVKAGEEKRKAALEKLKQDRALELEAVKQTNRRDLKVEDRAAQQKNALALKAAPGTPPAPDRALVEIADPSSPTGTKFVSRADAIGQPGKPDGGPTPAQQANNAEIDAARQALQEMKLDKAEIRRRTLKATNTGRDNPDYDPNLERLVRTATQRKVGNDLKFNLIHRRYLGPPPESSDPADPKALPSDVSAEEPGFIDRARDFLGFGGASSQPNPPGAGNGDTPAPARGAAPRRGTPRAGGRFGPRGRGGVKAIPKMSLNEIDDLVNSKGDSLSPADLKAIEARLAELGV